MRNKTILVVVAVIVVAAAIVIAMKSGNNNSNSQTNNTPSSTTSKTTTPTASPNNTSQSTTSSSSVTIQNMSFSPATLNVKKGTTVSWKNSDSVAHTVTSDTEHGPNSSTINPGETYSFTFTDNGTFNYHCTIHPNMHGSVVVTE